MLVAIGLFEKHTALDSLGPYAVLTQMPDAEVIFVAEKKGLLSDDVGSLVIDVKHTFDEVTRPDIVMVPGGFLTRYIARAGHPIIDWLRVVHPTTTWTTSVCTGALLLAAAGILDGLTATTHWTAHEDLEELGAIPVHERVVIHPEHRVVTGAGVSAGIDMALRLAQVQAGDWTAQRIQLGLEYDPQPPFDCGSPQKAPADIVDYMRNRVAAGKARLLEQLAEERRQSS